jgi:type III pantothenate kinase
VFSKVSTKYFNVEPLVVNSKTDTGISIDIDAPERLGADRIVNAVAAADLFTPPLLIIDMGTATTFDVVGDGGVYEGGAIAPGMNLSAGALFEKAALLPAVELKQPARVIGKNTQDAMRSGIVFGYVELVDGIINRIFTEKRRQMKVLATGGLARVIAEQSRHVDTVVPDLTLYGMKLIAQRHGYGK